VGMSHFPWGKAVRTWRWPLTSISAEVKKEWSHTSTPLHVSTTWTGTTSIFYFLKLIVQLNNTSAFTSYFTENTLILHYKTREINRIIVTIRIFRIESSQFSGLNGSLFSDAIKDSKETSRYSFIKHQIRCQTTAIRLLLCSFKSVHYTVKYPW